MAGYTKLFSSIVHSTIWRAENHVRLVWVTMLAMSDKNGLVESSVPGLADAARVSLDECKDALKILSEPDEYSRSKEFEGRRIKDADGGWELLNYVKYRGKLKSDTVREQTRIRQQEYRKRQKEEALRNVTVTHNAEVTRENAQSDPSPDPSPSPDPGSFLEIPAKSPKPKKRKPKYPPGYGTAVWEAYSEGFRARYGIDPKRNAKQSTLCCQLRERLGDADSVDVARYYPSTQNSYHVGRGHALAMLLADAEKIWTEWETGNEMTTAKAQEMDRLKKDGEGWEKAIRAVCDE